MDYVVAYIPVIRVSLSISLSFKLISSLLCLNGLYVSDLKSCKLIKVDTA